MKTRNPLLFWFLFLVCLSGALIVQSAFLPNSNIYSWIPYLTWPPVIFFFLYHSPISSLALSFFMSLLSSVFLSLSVFSLFFIYLFCFLVVFLIKNFFFSKSSRLFFVLVFVVSFCFPYLVNLAYDFSINNLSLSVIFFYFSKSFMTVILSLLLFPYLKTYLQYSSDF